MKRNILVVMVVMVAVAMQAQVVHNLGVQVGWDQQYYRLNEPSAFNANKSELSIVQPLYGGRLGFVYELSHESGFGLYTALNYLYGWNRSKWENTGLSVQWKETPYTGQQIQYQYYLQQHTLDLNAHLQYKFEVADEAYVGLYTGPSAQYIIQYNARDNFRLAGVGYTPNYYIDRPIEYSKEQIAAYYKQWNITWGLGLMLQYKQFYLRGGYDFGLVNPYNKQTFGEIRYQGLDGQTYSWFEKTDGSHDPDDRLTRGRLDSWNITLGVFFWTAD